MLRIQITNFKKYLPKRHTVYNKLSYCALWSKVERSHAMLSMDVSTRWIWVVLLCMATESYDRDDNPEAVFDLNCDLLSRMQGISIKQVNNSIKALINNNMIMIDQDLISARSEHGRIEEKRIEENSIAHSRKCEIDEIYQLYPKRLGKKKGFQRAGKVKDLKQLRQAVINYARLVEGKDPQYIKQFDSFMSVWEDYLSMETTIQKKHRRISPDEL